MLLSGKEEIEMGKERKFMVGEEIKREEERICEREID